MSHRTSPSSRATSPNARSAEAALRESEERFRHLVEQAGEAIFVYDLTGRVIDVNQEACDSLGYTRADLLALSVRRHRHRIRLGQRAGPLEAAWSPAWPARP